ncbi:MAG: threo-3-hydroxy-L-aspartate ammonia-lyase [Phycisphaerales bacterium]|nr:MAG: threo-3-hydroxy-L-aspartate ammonia-lyase [Phycisphaerales bacterium]
MGLVREVTFDRVRAAAQRLAGVAHRTPVLTSATVDRCLGAEVFFKGECFQRVGAFKFRGAYNALSALDAGARTRGVLTYSSGNHAQAVALASRLLGIPAVIVMPSDAPAVKLAATRGYLAGTPGEVVIYNRAETTREELGAQLASERGLTVIPPYDHPDVIAGQGTCAMELFEQAGELDALYVCVGGGGLLSGCATTAKAMRPSCAVIGAEPAMADDAARSFATRSLHSVRDPATIADGARTPSLGRYTFSVVLERVDRFVTVSEGEIAKAAVFVMERMKAVVEPSGALGVAALFQDAARDPEALRGRRVGVVLSGGNLDLAMMPELRRLAEG